MTLLVDLFGFLSVLLRGLALALVAFTIGGVIFRHAVVGTGIVPSTAALRARLAGFQAGSAFALVAVLLCGKSLDLSILVSTIGLSWSHAITAPFMLAGIVTCVAATALAVLARSHAAAPPAHPWREGLAALVLLASVIVTTHASGRIEARHWLLGISFLHQAAGAAWIGGLPYFLLVLAAALPAPARATIARRYSVLCVFAVAYLVSARFTWRAKLGMLGLGLVNVGVVAMPIVAYQWPAAAGKTGWCCA